MTALSRRRAGMTLVEIMVAMSILTGALLGHLFDQGAVLSAQNGLGCEEVIAKHTKGYVLRGTTFMLSPAGPGDRRSAARLQPLGDSADARDQCAEQVLVLPLGFSNATYRDALYQS